MSKESLIKQVDGFDKEFPNLLLTQDRFVFPEIADLRLSMEEILKELLPHVLEGEYSLLVGDDTSSRIPTLIWKKVIDHFYLKQGLKPVDAVFAQFMFKDHPHGLARLFPETKKNLLDAITRTETNKPGNKALISTEHMENGNHIRSICSILRSTGVNFNVVSLRTDESTIYYKKKLGLERIFTSSFKGAPSIYAITEVTGLLRETDDPTNIAIREDYVKIMVRKARRDANLLAIKLIDRAVQVLD